MEPTQSQPPAPSPLQRYGWLFWLAVMIILSVAIALPNFVRARTDVGRTVCDRNLRMMNRAIQEWATANHKSNTDSVTVADILDYLKGSTLPICPANGTYSVSTVSSAPQCTVRETGHSL